MHRKSLTSFVARLINENSSSCERFTLAIPAVADRRKRLSLIDHGVDVYATGIPFVCNASVVTPTMKCLYTDKVTRQSINMCYTRIALVEKVYAQQAR